MSKTAKYRSMATAYELTGSKAIVGSGISGLWLARLLTDAGKLEGLLSAVNNRVFKILYNSELPIFLQLLHLTVCFFFHNICASTSSCLDKTFVYYH
jgi:hypothetical protein